MVSNSQIHFKYEIWRLNNCAVKKKIIYIYLYSEFYNYFFSIFRLNCWKNTYMNTTHTYSYEKNMIISTFLWIYDL